MRHRATLSRRRLITLTARLTAWFVGVLVLPIALLDVWLAENVFSWLPGSILQFARVEDGAHLSTGAIAALVVVALLCNGLAGPVTEELYFRGHLLPRISSDGRHAPALNRVLFGLYHVWSPVALAGDHRRVSADHPQNLPHR